MAPEDGIPLDRDFMDSGWTRWLPDSALMVHMAILDAHLRDVAGDLDSLAEDERFASVTRGLEAHVWDEPPDLDPTNPEELEELVLHNEWVERVDSIATDNGLGPIRTNRDLIELMRRLGVIERTWSAGVVRWRPVSPLPLPEESIKLTAEERAQEDQIRWRGLHEKNAQALIKQFVERDVSVITTTINGVATLLDVAPEDAREAVLCLVEDPDFSSSTDLSTVGLDEGFVLRVDWDVFAETRISVRYSDPPE